MMSLDALLEEFARYVDMPENACMSLPGDAYLSPELAALEVATIFERSWLCVGREEYVPRPGDYYTIEVMDEPIVIVRDTHGVLRALNTACRHRAMPVVAGKGHTSRFVCPYHSWTYGTDGRLIGAPHMEESALFERDACRLPGYRLESWRGFLFVNLDDNAAPLEVTMAPVGKATASHRIEEQTEVLHYETTWEGNWKLSAENSMEYYHHIGLHADTVGVQMPAKGTYFPDEPLVDHTFTHQRCRIGEEFLGARDHPLNPRGDLSGLTREERETGYLVYVFPAFTMALRAGSNNWLSFCPDGPDRTRVLGGYLVWRDLVSSDAETMRRRAELIERVNAEDARATTELARTMRSRKAPRGPLSPFEKTIAQFYAYLGRTLAPPFGPRCSPR